MVNSISDCQIIPLFKLVFFSQKLENHWPYIFQLYSGYLFAVSMETLSMSFCASVCLSVFLQDNSKIIDLGT